MKYYLIGYPLGYSHSPMIHKAFKNDIEYHSKVIEEKNLESFIKEKEYSGLNVTIPYKEKVIKYLDVVDDIAKNIQAVNTIVNKNGILFGYNTDIEGIRLSLFNNNVTLKDKIVMILGSGGSYKTISYLAKVSGAKKIIGVSRTKKIGFITYQEALKIKDVNIIFNTTPIGTYPHIGASPINIDEFDNLECLFDMNYNPMETDFLFQGRNKNIKCINGLETLVYQAGLADELFFNKKIAIDRFSEVYDYIEKEVRSITLIGLPGSGKTMIGKLLAERLGYTFVDTDELIEKQENMKISEIFEKKGEKYFRALEYQIGKQLALEKKLIISTGGGMIENENLMRLFKYNSKIVFLDRLMAKHLFNGKRPLLKTMDDYLKIKERRMPLYLKHADIVVDDIDSKILLERIIKQL